MEKKKAKTDGGKPLTPPSPFSLLPLSPPSGLLVSSRISTTDTSLPGAVLRARYGLTLMGLRMLLPLSQSVMVMNCPGTVYPSIHLFSLKKVPEEELR